MPPVSDKQSKLMHGICSGSIKPKKGQPSKKVACEFVGKKKKKKKNGR